MAINKKLIHFKTFANFNSLKLSANEANTKYTTGISGTETSGNPDILYQSICFIKDTQQIWTHGLVYNASAENKNEPYFINDLYEDGQTGPEIEELYNNLVNALLDNRPIYGISSSSGGNSIIPMAGIYLAGFNGVILYASNIIDGSINSTSYTVSLLNGEYIFEIVTYGKDLSELVNTYDLATINGQSLINGGQNITIEGGTSGVFVKFNELFAVGTLTTNESDVFNVVKTAMESNTPLLLCDNNYSIILVSYYPLKVGNTIIASGILSLNVYNFTFTSGSNQITVTELSVATLSDNLVSALGLKSPAPSTTYPSANIGMGAKPTGTYNGLVLYNAGGSNSDKDFVNIIGETHVWNTDGSIGTVFANISGNAASATALETPRTINRMTFDGSTNVSNYVVCSTESNTVPKVINIPNMVFGPDARIWIEFTNGNTYPGVLAANVTHINGTTQTVLNFYGCTGQQPTGSGNSIHYKSIVFPAGVYEFVYYNANLYFTGNYVSEKKPYIVVGSSVASANTPTIALNHTLHTVVNLSNPRALTFTVSDSSMVHDYSFEFRSGTIKPTVTFPSAWKWANGTAPTISANKTYHVSVVNNCAVIAEF